MISAQSAVQHLRLLLCHLQASEKGGSLSQKPLGIRVFSCFTIRMPSVLLSPLILPLLPQIERPPEAQRPYPAFKLNNSQSKFSTSARLLLRVFQRCLDPLPLQHCNTSTSPPLVPAARQRIIQYQGRHLGRGIVSEYASSCQNQI